jgi:hypothetical protein
MSDSTSWNTSFLEVIVSSKNECVFVRDLSDLILHVICNALWTSMNDVLKQHIAWNNSTHAPLWWFYIHCGIEQTFSPGIICIICHLILRHLSEHGTSSIGKPLLPNDHIAKLNEWTVTEVTELNSSTVDKAALDNLKRQGSWAISTESLQQNIRLDIQFNPCWLKWQTKCSKLAAKDFEASQIHQDTWNRYLASSTAAVQILCQSNSLDGFTSRFFTYHVLVQ